MRLARFITIGTILACGLFSCHLLPPRPADLPSETVTKLLERRLPDQPRFVPGEVIVKLKPTVSPQSDRLRKMGTEAMERVTSGGELIYRIVPTLAGTMRPAEIRDKTMALVQEINRWDGVLYAQPNYILEIADTAPNDPRYRDQWHYFNNGTGPGQSPGGINLPRAWDLTTGSSQVVVAVIDTGILPTHEDIAGSPNYIGGFDMISDPARANDGDGRDSDPTDPGDAVADSECFPGSPPQPDSWHGTHVAGTVGVGKTNNGVGVAGVNWNVRVQAVRVLGKCGGTIADINDAIRWAAGLPVPGAPPNPTPAKVISMSLGGRGPCLLSPSTQAAIDDAVAAGVTIVVAAGNEASDASGFLPASCNHVITVAASDYRGHLVTRYSNFGSVVAIMAPGGDVTRDDNADGQNDGVLSMIQGGYARYNGTSMATPHVAGAVALWLAREPHLSPPEVLSRLQETALPRDSTQCPRPCGAGLLQVAKRADTPPPPPPPKAPGLTRTDLAGFLLVLVIAGLGRRRSADARFFAFMAVFTGLVVLLFREELVGPALAPLTLWTARMTVLLLHWVGVEAVQAATVISHPDGFAYEIAYSCVGVLPVVLFAAAVLAYPAAPVHRLVAVTIGLPTLLALNFSRLVHLFYLGVHNRADFEVWHGYLWRTIILLSIIGLWLSWAYWAERRSTRLASQANPPSPLEREGILSQKHEGQALQSECLPS